MREDSIDGPGNNWNEQFVNCNYFVIKNGIEQYSTQHYSDRNDKVKNVNIHATMDIHEGLTYYLLLPIKIHDTIFRKISFVKAATFV